MAALLDIEGTKMVRTSFNFLRQGDVPLRLENVLVYTNAGRWESMSSTYAPNTGMSRLTILGPDFDATSRAKCLVELDIDPVLVNDNKYASDGASLLFNINGSNYHINIHKNGGMECTGVYGSDPGAVNWKGNLGAVGATSYITCEGRYLPPH
ncbi:hypothetical protein [Pseudomonas rubra]|uniref:Uncharacterized protein n=1 Tax=Pseudomonas rubra TaxID=2942627 RepID=A0ABT5PE15_9PSED|nr:hypothetical protein [Pseudomonas rubra]MDD1016550.1 hypothetical protein [Pseudomonas rubra]MDD1039155.1 hypothetical protein [Pseudomonas rubra]MDD1157981.1 hypothetical protein [Pseudomonas rubra]